MQGPEMIEGVIFWQNNTFMTHNYSHFFGLMMIFRLTFAKISIIFNFVQFWTKRGPEMIKGVNFLAKCHINDPMKLGFTHFKLLFLVL